MSTLTATLDPTNSPPRIRLGVSGFLGSGGVPASTSVTITRADSNGITPVREGNPAALVGGAAPVIDDYEMPYGETVRYTAISNTGVVRQLTIGPLNGGGTIAGPWLVHLGVPDLSIQCNGITRGDRTYDVMQGIHPVLGRKDPIVLTDGMRRSPTFDFTIKTYSDADAAALLALTADGSTLLLQDQWPWSTHAEAWFVNLGPLVCSDLLEDFSQPYYLWSAPATVTSSPGGLLQAQWTYADAAAMYSTYSELDAAFLTYAALLADTPT